MCLVKKTNILLFCNIYVAICSILGVGLRRLSLTFSCSPYRFLAQPTNPVECVQSLTQKHVAKRYMIGEKFLPLRHES